MSVEEITSPEELKRRISEGHPLLVKFSAAWCPDCRSLRPHFEREAERTTGHGVQVLRISLQQERKAFRTPEHEELARELGIRNFPWVGFFNNGRLVTSTVEETNGSGYRKWLEYVLSRRK